MTKEQFGLLKVGDKITLGDPDCQNVHGEIIAIALKTWVRWYYGNTTPRSDPQSYEITDLFFYEDWIKLC